MRLLMQQVAFPLAEPASLDGGGSMALELRQSVFEDENKGIP